MGRGMIKYRPNCAVCTLIRSDKKLMRRIYNSRDFIPGGESLRSIHNDYEGKFAYASIRNHAKKHQFINLEAYNKKQLELQDEKEEELAVAKIVKAVDAVQSVINKGHEKLEAGELDITTDNLIRASQVKMNQEAKEVDQQLAILEMVAAFSSGQLNTQRINPNAHLNDKDLIDYDPSIPITTDN
jgi:hypothetical protein